MNQATIDFAPGSYLDPRVAAALAVPRRQTVSEWAADNRTLESKDSAEPGKWSNRRAPYLVGIMDALGDPEISDVVIMKAAQVGMSEAMRNVLGYWMANDPGPALWTMPDESSAEEAIAERLLPMVRATPALARHLTTRKHDVGRRKILLDHMELHCAWATSPQSLASRPKRFVIYDEVDKYPAWSGNEADPIALGNKRRTTFGHRSKGAELSTPTTRSGRIWKSWEASPVRLRYHVPCPHCGVFAPMAWSGVRWPSDLTGTRAEQGAAIDELGLAWYHCAACAGRIDERQRASMTARGQWAADDHETVDRNGHIVGERPKSRRVAFHVPGMISPWVSWSQMAGEFVAAVGDDARMMDWRNSRLGEPFEVRAASVKADAFDEKIAAGYVPGVVPTWAGTLIATADSQKDGFWYVIRAWGHGARSRLIAYGHAASVADLRERCLESRFGWEDDQDIEPIGAHLLLIDSGGGTEIEGSDMNRTDQVYQMALADPARIYAVKGFGGARDLEVPVRQSFVTAKQADGQAGGDARVALYHLKTGYFKDVLAARIAAPASAPDAWEIHSAVDADYRHQMTSEHKVLMRKGRAQVARWVPVSAGAANHLWDCEVYQIAGAQIAHVETIPPAEDLAQTRRLSAIARAPRESSDDWASATRGW